MRFVKNLTVTFLISPPIEINNRDPPANNDFHNSV